VTNENRKKNIAAEYVFTPSAAREELDAAKRFVQEAKRVLVNGGWIEPEATAP
jgi:hypothetical protein